MGHFRVCVKYCGNCNPEVDTPGIVRKVQALAPDIEWVWGDCPSVDLVLVASGCSVACAASPLFTGPTVTLVCTTLNGRKLPEADLAAAILAEIRGSLGTVRKKA
ncbi:hypothetical protein Gmet_2214 [Geobacter metallireducens GS-15]|uniref:Uncharacterized protein n=1 Tax=Geobacter metallireducens (strain ATCC 53774 / DSM 7210 / GS-15) TaxID=269799 RepID=Q39TI3_GEOMG|nr:hypothetical protein [Geobacter metallireducens]ABB32441.1 hypothetical protein Gmet_2214 [Geobacter metallireducens GS-15]